MRKGFTEKRNLLSSTQSPRNRAERRPTGRLLCDIDREAGFSFFAETFGTAPYWYWRSSDLHDYLLSLFALRKARILIQLSVSEV